MWWCYVNFPLCTHCLGVERFFSLAIIMQENARRLLMENTGERRESPTAVSIEQLVSFIWMKKNQPTSYLRHCTAFPFIYREQIPSWEHKRAHLGKLETVEAVLHWKFYYKNLLIGLTIWPILVSFEIISWWKLKFWNLTWNNNN